MAKLNPSETYDHFAVQFPFVYPEDHSWINAHDGKVPKLEVLEGLLAHYIRGNEAVVIVHSEPGIGAEIPLDQVVSFIAPHVLRAEIYVADQKLKSFVVVMSNGVAAGWTVG